jgi:alpha,alpha-trehalose phosphorylase
VIAHPAFQVDPWSVREAALDLDVLAQTESVFALGNGHLGMRGNLDEGEPTALPGTYLCGFYENRPLPSAETAYGEPESGQTVVNVTDGKLIRLQVDDQVLDIRYGKLHRHERTLDLRAGTLTRELEWESPTGKRVRVCSVRMISFSLRGIAAIRYEVTPLDEDSRLVIQSELVANGPVPDGGDDPRVATVLEAPLVHEAALTHDTESLLAHRTAQSGLRLAAGMRHLVDGPDNVSLEHRAQEDVARVTVAADVGAGETLTVTKLLSYAWSSRRSTDSLRAQAAGALAEAGHTGWEGLVELQRRYLDDFWDRADVELEGDEELQQAVRFALFQILQAGARGEGRALAAKGLTGSGYDGHAFWDTESFVLPVLTYTVPQAARDALMWRHSTLEQARARARELRLRGAAFPWRTIGGEECSGYWPASTAAMHVNADIADAVRRYCLVSGDEDFEREFGLELLAETARLWMSLATRDGGGRIRFDGVTGPDEYSALADNNVYTNLMAARNLRSAAEAAHRHPDVAGKLEIEAEEIDSWRDACERIHVPYNEDLEVHEQASGFTRHERWDFEATGADEYPLLLHFPYFQLYRRQVVKQADLVLALYACGDRFTAEEKARDFDYYEPLTVRDSSLSACTQAIVAAEVGHLDLAFAYLGEAALMDLEDLEHNTRDGLHIASLAGAWLAVVAGFGGLRDHDERLAFAPRLPQALQRISFRLATGRARLLVEVEPERARYTLREAESLDIVHHGREVRVSAEEPLELDIPELRAGQAPGQPPGREPARRQPRPNGDH